MGLPFPQALLSISGIVSPTWLASIFSGIIICIIVYKLTGLVSVLCFQGYGKLSRAEKIEWNNRGFSTFHAIIVASASFYLVSLSSIFKEDSQDGLMINRNSVVSNSVLGISIGYFLSDLAMIIWYFSSFGWSGVRPAPWTIYLFNNSLPHKWSRTDLHTNGSLLREHHTFCKFKMVPGCCWSEKLKIVHLQWSSFIPGVVGCKDYFVHLLLHSHVHTL